MARAADFLPGKEPAVVEIATRTSALRLLVDRGGGLYQLSYGRKQPGTEIPSVLPDEYEQFHPCYGNGFFQEPALEATHADGNVSTELEVVSWQTQEADQDVSVTRIEMRDRFYPFFVTLCFRAYAAEDVIEQWVEIKHSETGAVILGRLASSAPRIHANSYWLTQFQGNVMREATLVEEKLSPGMKVLDSKLTVRAEVRRNPSFILSLDGPAAEESGEVYGGTLAWSGNFQFAFDVDWNGGLRALAGVNSMGSQYRLAPGKVLTTPAMLWTWSGAGKGQVSRNFHRWARAYGIRDPGKARPVLLNNWETTYFDFDEKKLLTLLDGGKELGVDLFLLDDGWFSDKPPTENARVGLGDWTVNTKILPHGLAFLAEQARTRALGFGIWMEPEGVHTGSRLYAAHPEWTLRQPHREAIAPNSQVLLDLSRPAVQDYVWQAIDGVLGHDSGIAYLKWDANRYAAQPGSDYLGPLDQQNLPFDYQLGLYEVMRRMAGHYPAVVTMLCAGGGGRVDYGALKYFDSFWPSDDTDPMQRVYIQWGYSHVFPTWASSNHVTSMGQRPTKFALDVALMGALGVDRDYFKMSPADRQLIKNAITVYKGTIRELVSKGDLYRLESPYEGKRAALDYVLPDQSRAVLFVYQMGETPVWSVKPRGLDPSRLYKIREVNLPEGEVSRFVQDGKVIRGSEIMSFGLVSPLKRGLESAVLVFETVSTP